MQTIALLNVVAPIVFIVAWTGYGVAIERTSYALGSVNARMSQYRQVWLLRCLNRDVRIVDVQITAAAQSGTALNASIALIALGAALANLRLPDDFISMTSALPFGVETSRTGWQSKSIGLALIFAYSLFQYSSAYRLYSFVAQLVGAMPPAQANDTAEADSHSKRTARVYEAANRRFNRGQRAIFFALGYLGWFFGPVALIVSTITVVVMMLRLEFASDVLRAIADEAPQSRVEL
jgi:uncharacterized membrane protein